MLLLMLVTLGVCMFKTVNDNTVARVIRKALMFDMSLVG